MYTYLKQFIRSKEVYLSAAPQMSPALEQLLGRVEKDIVKRRNLSTVLSSRRELNNHFTQKF
ncbi:hypothetical protein HY065_01545 [Candidatus Berkelbacteria bacterium]|nr:hypothetical protein [Candidatus Berkelbacteria bacterium]